MKTQQKLMSVSVGDDTTEHLETELKAGWRVISMERVGVTTGDCSFPTVQGIVMVLLEKTTLSLNESY